MSGVWRVGVAGPQLSSTVSHPLHKLAVFRSSPMVQAVMRRLDEASIDAICTTEYGTMESQSGGELPVIVWIANPQDMQRASQIVQDEWANSTATRCPSCDYDLRGHAGKVKCPECGTRVTAPAPDLICAQCGEPISAGFDVCWQCGAEVSSSGGRDA